MTPHTLTSQQRARITKYWTPVAGPSRTAVHIQVRGDSLDDPRPWMQWVAERSVACLPSAGAWTFGTMGEVPQIRQITAVAGIRSPWDGGIVLTAATPAEATFLAQRLNNLCVHGASGSSRLGVRLSHDLENTQYDGTTQRRSGKDGRGARRAGRSSA